MGMAWSGQCHALLPQKAYFCWILQPCVGFLTFCLLWHLKKSILKIQSLLGCQIKLRSRAFCWGIVCFSTSSRNMINVKLNFFPDIAITLCTWKLECSYENNFNTLRHSLQQFEINENRVGCIDTLFCGLVCVNLALD